MRRDDSSASDPIGQPVPRYVVAALCAVWIAVMLFAQSLVFIPTKLLYVETVTGFPMLRGVYFLRDNLSKPLSPPTR